MFFTIVHPIEDDNCMEETPCDLTKPRIAPYKKPGNLIKNTVYWCNLKLAQERGLQFYQTRSHAIVLHNTLPAVCIEKVVCMKTKDELYQKVRLTPRVPRVVLNQIRKSFYKMNENKMQEHLVTNLADQRVPGRPGTSPWITEFLECLLLQLNSKIKIAKTMSKS